MLTDNSCDHPTYCGHCTPCFGSQTQSLAMPVHAHLQLMYTLVPLRACCLLSCLPVVPFLIFFLSTTGKSAPPSCTASADYGCSCPIPTTLANEGAEGGRWQRRGGWLNRPCCMGRGWSRGMGGLNRGGWHSNMWRGV